MYKLVGSSDRRAGMVTRLQARMDRYREERDTYGRLVNQLSERLARVTEELIKMKPDALDEDDARADDRHESTSDCLKLELDTEALQKQIKDLDRKYKARTLEAARLKKERDEIAILLKAASARLDMISEQLSQLQPPLAAAPPVQPCAPLSPDLVSIAYRRAGWAAAAAAFASACAVKGIAQENAPACIEQEVRRRMAKKKKKKCCSACSVQ